MKDARFYVVQYCSGETGCQNFLSGVMNREEWEWPMYTTDPFSVVVEHEYIYKLSDPDVSIDFDFYGSQTNFVSKQFLSVCDVLGVRYRAVPLRIAKEGGEECNHKSYFIFLPGEHVALLDRDQSEFAEDRDMETGEVAASNLFPGTPMYSWIKRFVVRQDCAAHLFRCTETMELVCSAKLKADVERQALKGIGFVPIDGSYSYDPWGEAP
nr:hypothetical protein RSP597_23610 [Ralstonia solanacearum]